MTKWILGSGSPRRKELLAGIGIEFSVRTKDTEEIYPKNLDPQEVPLFLAELKAKALLPDLAENETVICADTVVILNGEIIGKPVNRDDAISMLKRLSGQTHEVVTGVFIGNTKKQLLQSDSTMVTFTMLTDDEIANYVDLYQPFDKAGSYGVQEWLGYVAVEKLVGSYTNVMGLPTHVVYRMIEDWDN
ncbi:MAG: septum formation protein Maf [Candidatus Fluviicola riflensis]|nr:MAG: septum formation protein Maf [Candidatus Fluviicola riflensis]OGS79841.1 MAG: septum formation protein Maf [Candidatus Fluviicola riflensis]OGS82356.1 MAG: septum formation protein Maf [Fluviicola sp. RIFCSPHIGHO2_01_FULL_43_53]OGS88020.1 MAG: septum formation protein Maf [Fluviicola sp. RIFCSPHIGHO2_12_FULL_43_24]